MYVYIYIYIYGVSDLNLVQQSDHIINQNMGLQTLHTYYNSF